MTALMLLLLCSAASVQAFLAPTTVLAGAHLQQHPHQRAIATFTRGPFSAGKSRLHAGFQCVGKVAAVSVLLRAGVSIKPTLSLRPVLLLPLLPAGAQHNLR